MIEHKNCYSVDNYSMNFDINDYAIDEINAFKNKDGTYALDIYMWSGGERIVMKVPAANLAIEPLNMGGTYA